MIVIGSILSIVLISAYLFLGFKISESILQPDVKIFFWGLYTVTLITLVNLSLSIFFYTKIANKKGPLGPRGTKGGIGEKGQDGECKIEVNIKVCKLKTVQLMVEEAIQKYKGESDITPMERKTICNMVNLNANKTKINGWVLVDLKKFKKYLDDTNNLEKIEDLKENTLDQRIQRQNEGKDTCEWVKDLCVKGSEEIGGKNLTESGSNSNSECN